VHGLFSQQNVPDKTTKTLTTKNGADLRLRRFLVFLFKAQAIA